MKSRRARQRREKGLWIIGVVLGRWLESMFLKALHESGVITMTRAAAGNRPAVYAMPELINIAEGRDVFVKKKG